MRSAAITAMLVGSVLACGVAAGSAKPPSAHATSASFSYYGGPFDQVRAGTLDWGDFDGDGDLDLILTGVVNDNIDLVAWVYRNDGGLAFTRLTTAVQDAATPQARWGDYDGDGDLDLLIAGTGEGTGLSRLYRYDGGSTFTEILSGILEVSYASIDWGDQDNDGDLDVLLTGITASGTGGYSAICRNDGAGLFPDIGAGLVGVGYSGAVWGDYDSDGDLDALLTGFTDYSFLPATRLYRNDGNGTFVDTPTPLMDVGFSSAAWGDYDQDADLDILIAGWTPPSDTSDTKIYRNDGGVFVDIGAGLKGASSNATARWGDADNDGDLDILLVGASSATLKFTRVYLNQGAGNFVNSGIFFEPAQQHAAEWGDADNDGDLDIMLTGMTAHGLFSAIYRNDATTPNTPPTAPANLAVSQASNGSTFHVTFSWNAATDAQTLSPGLTYNLRVGKTPGGNEVMPSMALPNGYRRVARMGNVNQNLDWTLTLPPGQYYWSVQAVDASYAGSPFAAEQVINIAPTGVGDEAAAGRMALRAVQPNPFSAKATIEFDMARETPVTLHVLDVSGRLVRTLIDGASWPAGRQRVTWDGMDENGRPAPAGIYLATIDIGGVRDQRRVARLR